MKNTPSWLRALLFTISPLCLACLLSGCVSVDPQQFVVKDTSIFQAQDDLKKYLEGLELRPEAKGPVIVDHVMIKNTTFEVTGTGKGADSFQGEFMYATCRERPIRANIAGSSLTWTTVDGRNVNIVYRPGGSANKDLGEKGPRVLNAIFALDDAAKKGFQFVLPTLEEFTAKARDWRSLPQKPPMPEAARRYLVQGEECARARDFQTAIRNYTLSVYREPMWPQTHYNLGLLLGEQGQMQRAVYHLRCYLALVPDAPNADAVKDQVKSWESPR